MRVFNLNFSMHTVIYFHSFFVGWARLRRWCVVGAGYAGRHLRVNFWWSWIGWALEICKDFLRGGTRGPGGGNLSSRHKSVRVSILFFFKKKKWKIEFSLSFDFLCVLIMSWCNIFCHISLYRLAKVSVELATSIMTACRECRRGRPGVVETVV